MSKILKSYRLLILTLLATLCVACEKTAVPQSQRVSEDITRWEAELAKATELAKSDRENAAHHNAQAELIRSRIARLKAKLTH